MEYQVQRYKIGKIFALEATYSKEIIEFENWANREPQ